jgi:hypothetical protein
MPRNPSAPPNRGETHCKAKLTADDVRLIRELNKPGVHKIGYKVLAKKFEVGLSTIKDICTYASWKSVL